MYDIRLFLEGITLPLILGFFGGLARVARFGSASFTQFIGSVFVSAFTGVITHLFISDLDLSESTQAALVAVSGYSGGAILDAINSKICSSVEKFQVRK